MMTFRRRYSTILLAFSLHTLSLCHGFSFYHSFSRSFVHTSATSALWLSSSDGDAEIPQLPAPGSSSFNNNKEPSRVQPSDKPATGFASKKFELLYTCNICETRNSNLVSRVAYNNGVVIARCKGCQNQHLIADNLGFTKLWSEEGNIEEYFANRNENDAVHRVNKEVFELEKILGHDTKSGSILGQDGNPAME